ncbi:GIY-YIG nuclease family protein [Sphingobacterium daejeonense]|nr:GIY-YIG nuclease family protein [Sphingobacterium daejeonense]
MLTNYKRTVLYTGVTNNLKRRILEHQFDNNIGIHLRNVTKYSI